VVQERSRDREALLRALDEQGLRPGSIEGPQAPFTAELAEALHLYLARSASRLVAIQIEDLLGMVDPVNVPGTHFEYPNWQRKLSQDMEDIAEREDLRLHLDRIDIARQD
jgi:4-alpha-glucanotransferase